MSNPCATRQVLIDLVVQLDGRFARPGRIYLIGETSQVFENLRPWTTQVEFSARVSPGEEERLASIACELGEHAGIPIFLESPADVVPLPPDHEVRSRKASAVEGLEHLELHHFDPCSVAIRFIARGDEPDYHLVLTFLEHGWLTVEELDETVHALLPSFTAETIQQDPAEFRRKYKGLMQMWRAVRPGTVHRPSMV